MTLAQSDVRTDAFMASVSRICDSDPIERIKALRSGLPARWLDEVAGSFGWSRGRVIEALGLKPAATVRCIRADRPLDATASERMLAVLDMVREVGRMVERSGDPEGFDAFRWLGNWLGKPNGALDFRMPVAFLDTHEGVSVLRKLLARMESGAYS